MDRRARQFTFYVAFLAVALLGVPSAFAERKYQAMEGVDSVPTVFDFRIGDPKVALAHLDLIQSMQKNPVMRIDGQPPDTVLVFIGPSVHLISSEGKVDREARDAIARKISAMDDQGVRFEVCGTAARAHGLSPQSILPEVAHVGNGWISVIGYQQKGYSMVADF
jgi:uncharacterized protein